jgi:hypothetical protein
MPNEPYKIMRVEVSKSGNRYCRQCKEKLPKGTPYVHIYAYGGALGFCKKCFLFDYELKRKLLNKTVGTETTCSECGKRDPENLKYFYFQKATIRLCPTCLHTTSAHFRNESASLLKSSNEDTRRIRIKKE